jgi:hypothetical protein
MSFPYPQDRHRDRKEKGEQPYKDAREAMSQNEAQIQTEAEAFGEEHLHQTAEERVAQLEAEAPDLLREVGTDRERFRTNDADSTGEQA